MNPSQEILVALGKQPRFKDKTYRLNKFCLIENLMNGKLIFNGLTRSFIFMTNKEFENIYDKNAFNDDINYLYYCYFLVEENFDEHQAIRNIRANNQIPIDDFYLKHIREYTILTTTACNARCFYCYEQKVKKTTMNIETAQKIVDYITKYSPSDEEIELRWFGGEPLFNMKVIDTICQGLKDNNIQFHSHFTTNGYLFDEDVINKAIELWNIRACQITIDGTENVYNKAKNYVYKDIKSPYKRVINNISTLINKGVNVGIRMNCDMYNYEDLKDLIVELYNRFGNHPYLHLYCYPLFENEFYSRSDEDRKQVFEKMKEVEEVMTECNYFYGDSLSSFIRLNHCMVDNGKAVTISPDGNIGLCEHYVDSDFMGHIDEPEKLDKEVLNSWRIYEKDLEICSDCANFPNCVRASKCEEQSRCNPEYKEWCLRKLRMGMKKTYYNIMKQRNNNIIN